MDKGKHLKPISMVLLASILAAFPIFFAAPILMVVRNVYSRRFFWLSLLVVSGGLVAIGLTDLAIVVIGLTLLIGVFKEIEIRTKNMFVAGLGSVVISSAVTVATTQQWLVSRGINLAAQLEKSLNLVVKQAGTGITEQAIERIMQGAPSIIVILFIMTLFAALLLERQTMFIFKLSAGYRSRNLLDFKLPDFLIWIAMFSFLFSFINTNDKTTTVVATNIFNVAFVIYFLQGLAVVESLFRVWRLGFFTRLLTYVLFIVQLFPVIALVGVIDYWADFRSKINKKKLVKI